MTEQTVPAVTAGESKRAYLVRLGLAVAENSNGTPARGRFSKAGTEALVAAEAAGYVFTDVVKPVRKPKVAPTGVAEDVPTQATPADVAAVTVPLPDAPEVVRVETRARGRFFGLGNKGAHS